MEIPISGIDKGGIELKLQIRETIEQTDEVLITDSVTDVVNLLINKPKVYRISYVPKYDIYGLCDGYNYTHYVICKNLKKLGYNNFESKDTIDFMFIPFPDIEKEGWEVGGFERERTYTIPIETGYLLTRSKNYLKYYVPDLYNKLSRLNLFIKDPLQYPDRLYPEFKERNAELYCKLYMNLFFGYAGKHTDYLIMDDYNTQLDMLEKLSEVVTQEEAHNPVPNKDVFEIARKAFYYRDKDEKLYQKYLDEFDRLTD